MPRSVFTFYSRKESMRSIYYAAPFFNDAEMGVMKQMQEVVQPMEHLRMFYPHDASKEDQGSIQDPASRRRVYLKNEQAIIHNSEVLAWLDRIQLDGAQIQRCRQHPELGDWFGDGKELKQPDLGTVWEIGFARARGKTIAAFTLEPEGKMNLMLTESVDIVLRGWDEVKEYLQLPHAMNVSQFIRQKQSFWRGDVE
jgi:nucleoside 2-deoxyribosyltransferase